MRPHATHVTSRERGPWIAFNRTDCLNLDEVHAIRFSDGSEWDCINGWREHTLPVKEDPTVWNKSDVSPPGPTAPTNTSSSAPSSESPSPTASISSAPPEAILSEALAILSNLPPSCGWNVSVVNEQSNITYEVTKPTAVQPSDKTWSDLRKDALRDLREGL